MLHNFRLPMSDGDNAQMYAYYLSSKFFDEKLSEEIFRILKVPEFITMMESTGDPVDKKASIGIINQLHIMANSLLTKIDKMKHQPLIDWESISKKLHWYNNGWG